VSKLRGYRQNDAGGGIRHLDLGANGLAGGARHPPSSHLVLLFATLNTLASGVVCTVAGVVVFVVAFAF